MEGESRRENENILNFFDKMISAPVWATDSNHWYSLRNTTQLMTARVRLLEGTINSIFHPIKWT